MIAHIESERSVLGAMLRSSTAVNTATERLRPEDFSDPAHREIFSCMLALALGSKKVDLVTLDAELTRRGKLDFIGGPQKLVEVSQSVPSAANVNAYIDIVLEKSKLRGVLAIAEAITRRANKDDADADKLIELIEGACKDITDRTRRQDEGWITIEDAALLAYEDAGKEPDAIPTGFAELDEYLCGGLWKGELIIAGARPGKGKSALMLASSLNAARLGYHVGYFSLEMSPKQNGQRALSTTSLVGIGKQRMGPKHISDQDWAAMAAGLQRLSDDMGGRFKLYRGYRLTLEKIAMIARHARDRGELDMLVIDYLQLLRTSERFQNRVELLGYLSGELKQLALELDIPVLTASQIHRQGAEEGRRNPRPPMLDELRGSGDFEQDADTVLLTHIPEVPEDKSLKNISEKHAGIFERAKNAMAVPFTVEVAKQRQGALGRTWCLFKGMNMRFYEDHAH